MWKLFWVEGLEVDARTSCGSAGGNSMRGAEASSDAKSSSGGTRCGRRRGERTTGTQEEKSIIGAPRGSRKVFTHSGSELRCVQKGRPPECFRLETSASMARSTLWDPRQITRCWTWEVEMTQKRPRAGWHELDSRLSDENKGYIGNNTLFAVFSRTESLSESSRRQKSSWKRVRTCSGIMTRVHLIAQKQRGVTDSAVRRVKGVQQSHLFKVAHRKTWDSAMQCYCYMRRGHNTTPYSMKDAPAEQHRTWRKVSTGSKNTDNASFYFPVEARAMPAPTSKLPQDPKIVVDSGASMHMLSKKDLSLAEMDTLRRSRIRTMVVTASGEVQTNEGAQVYVHDLDLFVMVQLLEDTPAVLSLGKLCEENGYSYEWSSGQKPRLTKIMEKEFICKTDYFVLLVAPGLSSSSGTSLSSTSPPQDPSSTSSTAIARPTGMFWGVHRKSRRHRNARARTRFSGPRLGTPYESGIKAQFLYSLPKIPKLQSICANQDDKGALQKTHWRCSTSSN